MNLDKTNDVWPKRQRKATLTSCNFKGEPWRSLVFEWRPLECEVRRYTYTALAHTFEISNALPASHWVCSCGKTQKRMGWSRTQTSSMGDPERRKARV